jgi:indole-3-acetate monooxygenase
MVAITKAPGASELLERARRLRPLIEEEAARSEDEGTLTSSVVEALVDNQLSAAWIPRSLGGSEIDFVDALNLIEEISFADGATGWVLMAWMAATGMSSSYLPQSAVEVMYGGERFPLLAGQGMSANRAIPEPGGYRLSGKWSYASGSAQADYFHGGATVFEGDVPRMRPDGWPDQRLFYVPRDQVQLTGNWDVLGLRATASEDYVMDGVFIPEDFTHRHDCAESERGGSLYRLGIIAMACNVHAAFALGVGRKALDEIERLVGAGVGRFGTSADSTSFHEKLGSAEARYRSARAFVYETWRGVQAVLDGGELPSVRQHSLIRLAVNHATTIAAETCSFAYVAGGGVSLRKSTIQRCFRDIHGATQHMIASPPMLQGTGREFLDVDHTLWWRGIKLEAYENGSAPEATEAR